MRQNKKLFIFHGLSVFNKITLLIIVKKADTNHHGLSIE
ncbi:hypothetical protein C427_1848 [Paraglaciecola psychrophila 170]|jgi:hypothetical protein|uniref:Uncharacterized protein n=1 Tax=Paraglaciecola psychrophila 170 TaxID=1129794 RepID=K7APY2_9ALTE|nr:hypothetical protein C427_1848 [Paraglaciecola psychrophila 170]GAC37355.1 hypothetical protein GPSY_1726 [Paraglaciecola psychrophila 170]